MHCFRLLSNQKDSPRQAKTIRNKYDSAFITCIGEDNKLGPIEDFVEEVNFKLVFGLLANC